MNYEELYAIIPKMHWQWNVEDTALWLEFIGLPSLQNKFPCSIDGSILGELSEDDLRKQLEITSRILIKKLLNWMTVGLVQFDKFVQSQQDMRNTNKMHEGRIPSIIKSKSMQEERQIREKARCGTHPYQSKKYESNEMIIRQAEQGQVQNFYLKQKGGIIGSYIENQIVIMNEQVSRQHAEIIYEEKQYFIRDLGSSKGTFIRIAHKHMQGMIIEMGSNQFEVNLDNLTITAIQGPNKDNFYSLFGVENYSIGRKETNQISFPDDQHLSSIHSKIFRIKSDWFIEDIATTNGTWFRLSRPDQKSEPYLLQDESQFKLSSNLIYVCQINTNNRKTSKASQQKCLFCKTQDKNSIIIPCKHVAGCWNCLSKQLSCPICSSPISEVIKMFTA